MGDVDHRMDGRSWPLSGTFHLVGLAAPALHGKPERGLRTSRSQTLYTAMGCVAAAETLAAVEVRRPIVRSRRRVRPSRQRALAAGSPARGRDEHDLVEPDGVGIQACAYLFGVADNSDRGRRPSGSARQAAHHGGARLASSTALPNPAAVKFSVPGDPEVADEASVIWAHACASGSTAAGTQAANGGGPRPAPPPAPPSLTRYWRASPVRQGRAPSVGVLRGAAMAGHQRQPHSAVRQAGPGRSR